jgi:hypothetical protein
MLQLFELGVWVPAAEHRRREKERLALGVGKIRVDPAQKICVNPGA